jgi:hypothetical protein
VQIKTVWCNNREKKKQQIVVGLWTADDIPEELNLQQINEHFKSRGFVERSTQCQLCLVSVSVMWFEGSRPLTKANKSNTSTKQKVCVR